HPQHSLRNGFGRIFRSIEILLGMTQQSKTLGLTSICSDSPWIAAHSLPTFPNWRLLVTLGLMKQCADQQPHLPHRILISKLAAPGTRYWTHWLSALEFSFSTHLIAKCVQHRLQ